MVRSNAINNLKSLRHNVETMKRFKGRAQLIHDLDAMIKFIQEHDTEPELNKRIYHEAIDKLAAAWKIKGELGEVLIEHAMVNE